MSLEKRKWTLIEIVSGELVRVHVHDGPRSFHVERWSLDKLQEQIAALAYVKDKPRMSDLKHRTKEEIERLSELCLRALTGNAQALLDMGSILDAIRVKNPYLLAAPFDGGVYVHLGCGGTLREDKYYPPNPETPEPAMYWQCMSCGNRWKQDEDKSHGS